MTVAVTVAYDATGYYRRRLVSVTVTTAVTAVAVGHYCAV